MADWTQKRPLSEATVGRAPRTGGVYEISFRDKEHAYPLGTSRVIYYGQSEDLRRRLGEHLKGTGNQVVADFLNDGVALCARWLRTDDSRDLECELLNDFEREFGALPLGNAIGCRADEHRSVSMGRRPTTTGSRSSTGRKLLVGGLIVGGAIGLATFLARSTSNRDR